MLASLGCSNSSSPSAVHKYEEWLTAQSRQPRGTGTLKSPADAVFDIDRRGSPESGLSKVHSRNAPRERRYVYDTQINRLIRAGFSDGLAAVVVPRGRMGYIDESGRFVIPPIFRAANDFDDGVATAELAVATNGRSSLPGAPGFCSIGQDR
jgi:hypothetical protein